MIGDLIWCALAKGLARERKKYIKIHSEEKLCLIRNVLIHS